MLATRGICQGDPDRVARRITYETFCNLMAYWAKHPPLHLMMEAQLGINRPQEIKLF